MRNVTSPAHPVFDANRPWSVRRPRVRRARSVSVHRSIHVAAYASLLAFCYSATSYALPLQQPAMALGALILLTEIVLGRHSLVLGGRPGLFLLLYSLAVAASVPLSISFGTSFAGFQTVAKLTVMYIVTVNVATTRTRVYWLLIVLVILMAVYPGIGAIKFYLAGTTKAVGRANWRGLFGNANMVAMAMLMHLPFAVAFFVTSKRTQWKLFWAIIGVILVAATVLTKSRAGFLAMVVLAVSGLVLSKRKLYIFGATALAVLVISVAAPPDFKERIATTFVSGEGQDQSIRMRREYWAIAVDIALDHPLIGVGIDNYERANAQRMPSWMAGGLRYQDTHSTFLNVWAEIGTPGAVVFFAAIVLLLLESRRALHRALPGDPFANYARAGTAAFIVFVTMGVFNSFQNAWFFFVLFAGQILLIQLLNARPALPSAAQRKVRRSARLSQDQ
ncbi:MAG: O-antigen ligase family protein [Gemmatimonadota bacterium]|nr:O-antigen ligase family protein [Gemmatimonadota bacterium]